MNRTATTACALLLTVAVPAASATAATKKKPRVRKHVRTITIQYSGPCGASLQTTPLYGPTAGLCGGIDLVTTARDERYMTVTVTDTTGQKVPVSFVEDGSEDAWDVICGSTKNMVVSTNDTYELAPLIAVGDKCPAPATQGTITIKLSNLP